MNKKKYRLSLWAVWIRSEDDLSPYGDLLPNLVCSYRSSSPREDVQPTFERIFGDYYYSTLCISHVPESWLPSHGFLYVLGEVPGESDEILSNGLGWRVCE